MSLRRALAVVWVLATAGAAVAEVLTPLFYEGQKIGDQRLNVDAARRPLKAGLSLDGQVVVVNRTTPEGEPDQLTQSLLRKMPGRVPEILLTEGESALNAQFFTDNKPRLVEYIRRVQPGLRGQVVMRAEMTDAAAGNGLFYALAGDDDGFRLLAYDGKPYLPTEFRISRLYDEARLNGQGDLVMTGCVLAKSPNCLDTLWRREVSATTAYPFYDRQLDGAKIVGMAYNSNKESPFEFNDDGHLVVEVAMEDRGAALAFLSAQGSLAWIAEEEKPVVAGGARIDFFSHVKLATRGDWLAFQAHLMDEDGGGQGVYAAQGSQVFEIARTEGAVSGMPDLIWMSVGDPEVISDGTAFFHGLAANYDALLEGDFTSIVNGLWSWKGGVLTLLASGRDLQGGRGDRDWSVSLDGGRLLVSEAGLVFYTIHTDPDDDSAGREIWMIDATGVPTLVQSPGWEITLPSGVEGVILSASVHHQDPVGVVDQGGSFDADGRFLADLEVLSDGKVLDVIALVDVSELVKLPVSVSLRSVTSVAGDQLELGKTDPNAPIIPRPLPLTLNDSPKVAKGLVADGVTPLILRLEKAEELDPRFKEYALKARVVRGGEIKGFPSGDITSLLHRFDSGGSNSDPGQWLSLATDEANQIEFPIEGVSEPRYAYLGAIRSDDLLLEGTTELQVEVTIAPVNSPNDIVARTTVLIRKPPVFLIHGYNTRGDWGKVFKETLGRTRTWNESDVRDNFVVTVTYGQDLAFESMGNQDFALENTVLPLNALVGRVDQAFREALGSLRSHWTVTRHDVVAHSQGGLLSRMLCAKDPPEASLSRSYRDVENYYRGRFHRVITIGSPHNGSRLVRYIMALHSGFRGTVARMGAGLRQVWNISPFGWDEVRVQPEPISKIISSIGVSVTGIVQDKFDPIGQQIRELNDPNGAWVPDAAASFHLVRTTVNGGKTPSATSSVVSERLLSLGSPLGALVLPRGSDGVVDWDSMGAHGPNERTPDNVFTLPPTNLISHSGPAEVFSRDAKHLDTIGQTSSPEVAAHVRAALDQDPTVPAADRVFASFHLPPLLPKVETDRMTAAGQGAAFIPKGQIMGGPSIKGQGIREGVPERFEVNAVMDPDYALAGEINWFFEVLGFGGATTEGLSWTVDSADSRHAEVIVGGSVVGDVIAYAFYLSPQGEVVVLKPHLVNAYDPDKVPIESLTLLPQSVELPLGSVVFPSLFVNYADGSQRPAFLDGDLHLVATPQGILSLDDTQSWLATQPGTVTVSAEIAGFSAETEVTVLADDAASGGFSAWQAEHFSEAQLQDVAVSGPVSDPDRDGFPNLAEFALLGDPFHHDSLVSVETGEADGASYPFLRFDLRDDLGKITVTLQRSDDLNSWTDWQVFGTDTAGQESALVVERIDLGGGVRSLKVRDLSPLDEGRQRQFRLWIDARD